MTQPPPGTVHQVVSILERGDAVGNEARLLQDRFHAAGYASEVFAAHRGDREPIAVRDLDELFGSPPPDLVLYHLATTSIATARLAESAVPLAVMYHNVTPAEFFWGIDVPHYTACIRAGDDLRALRGRAELAVGHSEFSRRELVSAGFRRTAAVPLLLDLGAVDEPAAHEPPEPPQPTVLLTVGRISPNKRIEEVLALHRALRRAGGMDAELWVVGDGSRLPGYSAGLRELAMRLGEGDAVRWVGSVTAAELARCYRRASLYVCMSEHEGFAAPLVEAMHWGVPVIACDAGAVAETLGGAGLLLPRCSSLLGAEAATLVLGNPDLRTRLVARGRRRAGELHADNSFGRLLQVLRATLPMAAVQ